MMAFKVVIAALLAAAGPSHGFAIPPRHVVAPGSMHHATDLPSASPLSPFIATSAGIGTSTSALRMASDDEGGGILTKLALAGVLVVFLLTSLLPFLSQMQADNGPANLSGAVATRDAPDAYKNYESSFDRLSRAKIQEKLSRVPAFYLVNKVTGRMAPEIYASYEDAVDAAKAGDGFVVKATTLNQVMYTLVLKRGRMLMPPPPSEIAKAEEALRGDDGAPLADGENYILIPSAQARKSAAEVGLKLDANDLPLFVADRLAFASSGGAQVPLFFEKEDAIVSYQRLQQQSGSKLPAEPKIRATSLLDELNSMEKGTRPGVKQLEFYAAADDLMRADALMGN
eukprot:CAMPEP_0181046600 /NCGR_PEP_ID=MMETSP1070-20121207/14434_1 /TAXON_ID=265543 /ORGANISM="Minutocellus polymorphus, Strain NH13" /LENGTH=341 /DNA_ID=CAMNT_0023125219 /DNA_START=13 /DNA_END=1038 /DNA_ORIENTATION=-